jgi:nucleoside-triphosphatase
MENNNKYYKNVLLTGRPGIGKTSVILRVIQQFPGKMGGFITGEIKRLGKRVGFELETLDGKKGILAHIDIKSPYKVSKYGVNIDDLEKIGVKSIKNALGNCELIVIDEIGKMELFSSNFRDVVLEALNSNVKLLATITYSNLPFVSDIKSRNDVIILDITVKNRTYIHKKILKLLKKEM